MNKDQKRIWLSAPHMGGAELDYIEEAFSSNWIAPLGANVDAFEQQLASYVSVKGVAVLNSGTAALHLALIEAGVSKDDVVLCQNLTFAASAFPITYAGAQPVFIDSELSTWNMDPELLEKALHEFASQGKRVAAVIIVHLYGMPAQIQSLLDIAAKYSVPVIEDAAEALGSSYNGKKCGSFGHLSVLSFNGNKIITTSGGGALLSNDTSLTDHAKYLSTQAKDSVPYYQHSQTGFNYRMSNITAGIGRGQMQVIDERVEKRRAHFNLYKTQLNGLPGLQFQPEPAGCFSNRWLTTILINPSQCERVNVETIRLLLEANNIESRRIWKPMHAQPVFDNCISYLNGNAAFLFDNGLCLPSGSSLEQSDILKVCSLIKSVYNA